VGTGEATDPLSPQKRISQNMWTTEDIGLVGALALKGIHPSQSRVERRRLVFTFEETPQTLELREAFYGNRLEGSLNIYNGIVRSLTLRAKEGR
jgi:hypothetical protein